MEKKPLKKIFITDDDPDILLICKYSLKKHPDIESIYLNSAEASLKEALISPPDIILMDVMMPNMSGIDFVKTCQSIPTLAHIPIVLFTAKAQQDEITEYTKLPGVIDVIIKPFNPLLLYSNLQKIWDTFQERSNSI